MDVMIEEADYYARHFRLPGFTPETQIKLGQAKVLIIGVGGLGCPAALYLAGAGIGTIGLCDADVVSATNLHRQILFQASDIGRKKVDVAAERLSGANPFIKIVKHDRFAESGVIQELIAEYHIVVDATDNFAAKYAINDACEIANIPMVYGSIFQFEGQVSVFHHAMGAEQQGFSYRDLYPNPPPQSLAQNCGEAGVIGVLPGLIGSLQASEVIKLVTGIGAPLSGKLLIFDLLDASQKQVKLIRAATEATCPGGGDREPSLEMSAEELRELGDSGGLPFLIDVREAAEREVISLGGMHIPLAELPNNIDQLPQDELILLYCKSGIRSSRGALYLNQVLPGNRVRSLKGGVDGFYAAVTA